MYGRDQSGPARAAGAAPAAGAESLSALAHGLSRLVLTVASVTAVLAAMLATAVLLDAFQADDVRPWTGVSAMVAALVAVATACIGAARLRRLRQSILAAAENLDRRSRARASELAQANAELARIGRQRSELFASMSHELRTPLNGILGYSRVLLDGLDGDLTPEQREDVFQILASGQGLLGVVNDLLDFSKLEAGRTTFLRQSVQLRIVADDVVGRVQPLADEKGLTLVNAMPADLPPALADEHRALQVLLNLVANAIKFTDQGGVTIAGELRDGEVHVSVADTGIGIPAEAHELIFEPFRQADQGDTRRHGGTGLGLAICRRLLDGMGGRIWMESAPRHGTTVHVTLPMAEDATANAALAPHDASPTMLVVGNREQASALAHQCEREGLTPVLIDGGAGLREGLARRHPAVALFDLSLPRAAGWQALHALRADVGGREVPAVLFAPNGSQSFSLALGSTDCLLHSTVGDELLGRLGDLLHRAGPTVPANGSRTVLLATADESVAARAESQLERAGYDVRRAASGPATLALARTYRVAAVVLDLLVPGGALSTLAELRDGVARSTVPIVIVSPATLSPGQQRGLYQDVIDVVRRRGTDGPPAAAAIRRALGERPGAALATRGR